MPSNCFGEASWAGQAQWALFWPWLGAAGAAVAPTVGVGTFIYNMALGYLTDPGRRAEAFRKFLEWLLAQKIPGTK